MQDGVEEYNTLDHNLAAYVHVIGPVGAAACSPEQLGRMRINAVLTVPRRFAALGAA